MKLPTSTPRGSRVARPIALCLVGAVAVGGRCLAVRRGDASQTASAPSPDRNGDARRTDTSTRGLRRDYGVHADEALAHRPRIVAGAAGYELVRAADVPADTSDEPG